MKVLAISNQMTENEILKEIQTPPSIDCISMSECSISKRVWEAICSVKGLKKLDLVSCHISRVPRKIKQLTRLEVLNLCGSDLTELPSTISEMGALRQIILTNSGIMNLPTQLNEVDHPLTLNLIGCEKLLTRGLLSLHQNSFISIIIG